MNEKNTRYFVSDFETTVYKGQTFTEVWASGSVELYTEDFNLFHSIDSQFDYFKSLKTNIVVYYHNLKFDGNFWLPFLIGKLKLKQAYYKIGDKENEVKWYKEKDMPNNSFKYAISDKGQWYSITIKVGNKLIDIRDSLKLLPFSIDRIGKAFKTKYRKTTMEYEGFRYSGCDITDEEKEYIKCDLFVLKEALEITFNEGHKELTIGACCLKEFKRIVGREDYKQFFPNVYDIELDKELYQYDNVGEYILRSYKGGWCYLVKGKEQKIYHNGVTADVNSLYPSMMHSESGNRYPIGTPNFWSGNYIHDNALKKNRYYFVRIKTRFYLKPNMLPFIQIKGSFLYDGTENLESSDVYDGSTDKYYTHYHDSKGNLVDTRVTLTLTMIDFELLKEHYNLVDFEILDGCWFYTEIGLFDEYIDKYRKIKIMSEGAIRELAKLFLNNLYGKMASSKSSSFKLAYEKDSGIISFLSVLENDKQPGYIPIGSAITSYARNFTIRAAQKNFHGVDKKGFIYADTDSIHCDVNYDELIDIKTHDSDFCCWKIEGLWDVAFFSRQKTYIEHMTHDSKLKEIEPHYDIKCAGMPTKCKDLFEISISTREPKPNVKYNDEELLFISQKRTLYDFKIGLNVPGKLAPKKVNGGVILTPTPYIMRR